MIHTPSFYYIFKKTPQLNQHTLLFLEIISEKTLHFSPYDSSTYRRQSLEYFLNSNDSSKCSNSLLALLSHSPFSY